MNEHFQLFINLNWSWVSKIDFSGMKWSTSRILSLPSDVDTSVVSVCCSSAGLLKAGSGVLILAEADSVLLPLTGARVGVGATTPVGAKDLANTFWPGTKLWAFILSLDIGATGCVVSSRWSQLSGVSELDMLLVFLSSTKVYDTTKKFSIDRKLWYRAISHSLCAKLSTYYNTDRAHYKGGAKWDVCFYTGYASAPPST